MHSVRGSRSNSDFIDGSNQNYAQLYLELLYYPILLKHEQPASVQLHSESITELHAIAFQK